MRQFIRFCHRVRNRLSRYENLLRMRMHNVEHGRNCTIHGKLYFHIYPRGGVKIGNNFYCSSGNNVNALCANKRGSIYATQHAQIIIGDNVGMSSPTLFADKEIRIGNHVKLGANVIIIDTDSHSLDYMKRRGQYTDWGEAASVVIEDDVFIGMNSVILKGVTIGARTIVAANSVVTKSFPADCVIGGNPAKIIRRLNDASLPADSSL